MEGQVAEDPPLSRFSRLPPPDPPQKPRAVPLSCSSLIEELTERYYGEPPFPRRFVATHTVRFCWLLVRAAFFVPTGLFVATPWLVFLACWALRLHPTVVFAVLAALTAGLTYARSRIDRIEEAHSPERFAVGTWWRRWRYRADRPNEPRRNFEAALPGMPILAALCDVGARAVAGAAKASWLLTGVLAAVLALAFLSRD